VVFLGALVWFIRHRDHPDESLYTRPRDRETGPSEGETAGGEGEPAAGGNGEAAAGENEPRPVDRDDARSSAAPGESDR